MTDDLETLASSKDTTPEMLQALINEQEYFARVFGEAVTFDPEYPIDPNIGFVPSNSGFYEPGQEQGR